jgi:hypothetical protein
LHLTTVDQLICFFRSEMAQLAAPLAAVVSAFLVLPYRCDISKAPPTRFLLISPIIFEWKSAREISCGALNVVSYFRGPRRYLFQRKVRFCGGTHRYHHGGQNKNELL